MFSSSLLLVVLAGAATAFTPAGFEPASSNNLTVVFGNTLATNGKNILKAETAQPPIIGTSQKLFGSYTIMMVDPDIPPQTAGGPTGELLHWMQSGLVSANNATFIGGVRMFELINPTNTSALATYIQPSPPNKSPNTHRYTQMLLNTTGNSSALSTLSTFAKTRSGFSAVNVVKSSGLNVLFGNSFDVTNTTLIQSNITKTTASVAGAGSTGTGTASAAATGTGTTPKSAAGVTTVSDGRGAYIAGLGALAAAVLLL
ncbi:phosphatidylethanolamine-binding protein [Hyaloscypha sp. PMI_1271]|nr:phosphatidylethanolamine-binding protein [Hyaloscypha sp. PMI_1271]